MWQLGGAVWFGAAICDPLGEPRWKGAALNLLLGLALCFNPVLDAVRGPQALEGAVTGVWVSRGQVWRQSDAYSPTIHARVGVETAEGAWRLDLRGRQANLWVGRFEACREREDTVHAMVLRHLDAVLDLTCSRLVQFISHCIRISGIHRHGGSRFAHYMVSMLQ